MANSSLPSIFCRALGKDFAECLKGSRQRKRKKDGQVTVTAIFPSATMARHWQSHPSLPSALALTLGKG